MREASNVESISTLPIDFMGFIFYEKSPRCVAHVDMSFLSSWKNPNIKKVGVFVNENTEKIMSVTQKYQLDFVQLHGNETIQMCDFLRQQGLKIIKTFSIQQHADLEKTQGYVNKVDYFLFDTKTKHYGGSGKKFDWSILKVYQGSTPFFLSGGIGIANSIELSEFHHSQFFGIDLNSCFETMPAKKDYSLLNQFINNIKNSNR